MLTIRSLEKNAWSDSWNNAFAHHSWSALERLYAAPKMFQKSVIELVWN